MSSPARATRLHWFRHGEVSAPWRGRIYGDLDVPLSERGAAQAAEAVALLAQERLAAVVSSGLSRAEYTAARIRAPRGLERRDEPALRELSRGIWAGKLVEELSGAELRRWRLWQAAPSRRRPRGGESLEDLARRVLPCVRSLVGEFPGQCIALVAHSWVIRVLTCHVLGLSLDAAPRLELPGGALVSVDWPAPGHAERPVLSGFHLDRLPDQGRTWFRGAHRG